MCLFFFLFEAGFSGTSIFEDFVLSAFNFFLGLPILTLGIFDQDLPADYVMAHPAMYVSGRKNLDLNAFQVGKWILSALLDGFLVYFFTIWSVPDGGGVYSETDYYVLGLAMYGVLVLSMNWRLLFELKTIVRPALLPKSAAWAAANEGRRQPRGNCSMCGWSLWVWMGSVLSFFAVTLIYSNLSSFAPAFFGVSILTFTMSSVWLQLLLIPVICVVIVALYTFLADEFVPSVVQLGVEEAHLLLPQQKATVAASPAGAAAMVSPAAVEAPPAAAAAALSTPEDLEQGGAKSFEIHRQLSAPAN